MNEITRQIRQIKWVEIIRECNSSGIPKNQWMAEHGINSKSFYRYQKMPREHFGRDYLYGKSQNGQTNTREVDEWNNNAVRFCFSIILQIGLKLSIQTQKVYN